MKFIRLVLLITFLLFIINEISGDSGDSGDRSGAVSTASDASAVSVPSTKSGAATQSDTRREPAGSARGSRSWSSHRGSSGKHSSGKWSGHRGSSGWDSCPCAGDTVSAGEGGGRGGGGKSSGGSNPNSNAVMNKNNWNSGDITNSYNIITDNYMHGIFVGVLDIVLSFGRRRRLSNVNEEATAWVTRPVIVKPAGQTVCGFISEVGRLSCTAVPGNAASIFLIKPSDSGKGQTVSVESGKYVESSLYVGGDECGICTHGDGGSFSCDGLNERAKVIIVQSESIQILTSKLEIVSVETATDDETASEPAPDPAALNEKQDTVDNNTSISTVSDDDDDNNWLIIGVVAMVIMVLLVGVVFIYGLCVYNRFKNKFKKLKLSDDVSGIEQVEIQDVERYVLQTQTEQVETNQIETEELYEE